jgi:hypothetical protein
VPTLSKPAVRQQANLFFPSTVWEKACIATRENLRALRKFSDGLCLLGEGAQEYSRAKTPRAQSDGPSPVIPNECEGSEKDFSLRSK